MIDQARVVLTTDADTGVTFDPETGEIINVLDAPQAEADTEALALWLGEKKTEIESLLAAQMAAKQVWIDRINERFDARINELQRQWDWLVSNPEWVGRLEAYARDLLKGAKKRSFNVGLLKLGFRTKPARTQVVDTDAALEYVQEHDELVDRCVTVFYSLRKTDYIALRAEIPGLPGIEDVPESEVFLLDGKAVELKDEQS